MTTTVKILTHSWPVSVVALDQREDGSIAPTDLGMVKPHSEASHWVWQERKLLITEMKEPPKDAA